MKKKTKTNNRQSGDIKLTAEYSVPAIRNDSIIPVLERDWTSLKSLISTFSSGTSLWEIWLSVSLSLAPAFFSTLLAFENGSRPWFIYYSLGLIAAVSFMMSLVFLISKRKETKSSKKSVLDKMNEIEAFSENADESRSLDIREQVKVQAETSWKTEKTSDEQGGSFKQIKISNTRINTLSFTIQSSSPYWRAGFKLSNPNSDNTPPLRTKDSFLFSVERTENRLELHVYFDGKHILGKPIVPKYKVGQKIAVLMERNENNFIFCYINDSLEFNKRLHPDMFKKVHLCSWADRREYELTIDEIEYVSS